MIREDYIGARLHVLLSDLAIGLDFRLSFLEIKIVSAFPWRCGAAARGLVSGAISDHGLKQRQACLSSFGLCTRSEMCMQEE